MQPRGVFHAIDDTSPRTGHRAESGAAVRIEPPYLVGLHGMVEGDRVAAEPAQTMSRPRRPRSRGNGSVETTSRPDGS
jgi:hypothetical protein